MLRTATQDPLPIRSDPSHALRAAASALRVTWPIATCAEYLSHVMRHRNISSYKVKQASEKVKQECCIYETPCFIYVQV